MIDIQVGKTYLDTKGREHLIRGFVKIGNPLTSRRNLVEDETKVWSLLNHFDRYTGKALYENIKVVDDLNDMGATDAILYWENVRDLYLHNNTEERLHLISDILENLDNRITYHKARL